MLQKQGWQWGRVGLNFFQEVRCAVAYAFFVVVRVRYVGTVRFKN